MLIGDVCKRGVGTIPRDRSVQEAAILMREHHVGDLVVVSADELATPLGIVTDRDIVIGVVAPQLDPAVVTVGDIVSRALVTVPAEACVFETIERMQRNGVRRLPVVNAGGALVGIIAFDDLLRIVANAAGALANVPATEQQVEVRTRR